MKLKKGCIYQYTRKYTAKIFKSEIDTLDNSCYAGVLNPNDCFIALENGFQENKILTDNGIIGWRHFMIADIKRIKASKKTTV